MRLKIQLMRLLRLSSLLFSYLNPGQRRWRSCSRSSAHTRVNACVGNTIFHDMITIIVWDDINIYFSILLDIISCLHECPRSGSQILFRIIVSNLSCLGSILHHLSQQRGEYDPTNVEVGQLQLLTTLLHTVDVGEHDDEDGHGAFCT